MSSVTLLAIYRRRPSLYIQRLKDGKTISNLNGISGMNAMEEAKKVLVVDDNRTLRSWMEKTLSAEGYRVLTAGNGKEGLDVATREKPDLIVSDIDMPIMDGGEMVSKLKASGSTKDIPVVFLSGLIRKDEILPESSNDVFYMSKMSRPAELIAVVRNMLFFCQKHRPGSEVLLQKRPQN
jgi:CheY-like chemotaxis protein